MTENSNDSCTHAANLTPCCLKTSRHTVHKAADLAERLSEVFEDGDVFGIVWATNGARRILDVKAARFDDERTYEIRFWQVIGDDNADLTLAHEFRWVNGVGAVELTLTANTAKASSVGSESGKPCVSGWSHKVSYLQHESSGTGDTDSASEPSSDRTEQDEQHVATKPMTVVEFTQEEDKYGNTVVVDQLFTGDWNQS
jgi:hypothetical protein